MDHALLSTLNASGFIPHGHCFLWTPALLAMFVGGDGLIALAYYSIPAALMVLWRKRRDLRFNWMFVMFSAFIFLCGTTHVVAIWNIWNADYWIEGWLKVATALASVITAIALWPLLPKALKVPSTRDLEETVAALQGEVQERRRAEAEAHAAREAAEVASRAKSEFLSRMSHELRTPMNAVLGFSQLLRMQPASGAEVVEQRAREIEGAGWHLLSMIDDVLDLSRIETGRVAVSNEPVNLGAVVSECVGMAMGDARREHVSIDNRLPQDWPLVSGDRTRLKQIVSNLVSNAIKYNRRGGAVTVNATQSADCVTLTIADTGCGLTREQLARLFQPFERLGAEQGDRPGTGIGLVIAKHLALLMQGRIEVESEVGRGTAFHVTLRSAATLPKIAVDRATATAEMPAAARTLKLLYIEDNPSNVALMRDVIDLEQKYTLLVADTGAGGLELARQELPDLIIVDIALPDTTGLVVCQQLRAEPVLRDRPLIALSANAMKNDVEAGIRAGFDAYLTKPLDVQQFRTKLNELLASPSITVPQGEPTNRLRQ